MAALVDELPWLTTNRIPYKSGARLSRRMDVRKDFPANWVFHPGSCWHSCTGSGATLRLWCIFTGHPYTKMYGGEKRLGKNMAFANCRPRGAVDVRRSPALAIENESS